MNKLIIEEKKNTYSTSVTKNFWCHICKKVFSKISIEGLVLNCKMCFGPFCEEIDINSDLEEHPSNFTEYNRNNVNSSNTNNNSTNSINSNSDHISSFNSIERNNSIIFSSLSGSLQNNSVIRAPHLILNTISNFLVGRHEMENNLDNIISQIMANDPNIYGNPPASNKAIENLDKVNINEEFITYLKENKITDCSICKEEFTLKDNARKIPCNHIFHEDCIVPWLKNRNSCPVCRFELITDDEDYENRRKKSL